MAISNTKTLVATASIIYLKSPVNNTYNSSILSPSIEKILFTIN